MMIMRMMMIKVKHIANARRDRDSKVHVASHYIFNIKNIENEVLDFTTPDNTLTLCGILKPSTDFERVNDEHTKVTCRRCKSIKL